jgi:hypothetical protein
VERRSRWRVESEGKEVKRRRGEERGEGFGES